MFSAETEERPPFIEKLADHSSHFGLFHANEVSKSCNLIGPNCAVLVGMEANEDTLCAILIGWGRFQAIG